MKIYKLILNGNYVATDKGFTSGSKRDEVNSPANKKKVVSEGSLLLAKVIQA